jgi:hypothetical protein
MISLSAICLYSSASFFYNESVLVNEDIVHNITSCFNVTSNHTFAMNADVVNVTTLRYNTTHNTTVRCETEYYSDQAESSSTSAIGTVLFVMSAMLLVPYFAIK